MKIAFALPVKFPTSKAYGVITDGTIRALTSLGHDCTAFVAEGSESDIKYAYPLRVIDNKTLSYLRASYSWRTKLLPKIFFVLHSGLYALIFRRLMRLSNFDVIWTRSVLLTFICLLRGLRTRERKYLLEIHRKPSRVESFLVYLMKKKIQLQIVTIKHSQIEYFQSYSLANEVFCLPMAAKQEFFAVGNARLVKKTETGLVGDRKVCYLGSSSSSGTAPGFEFMADLDEILHSEDSQLFFVGVDNELELGIPPARYPDVFKYFGYVDHDSVPEIISQMDIGLIPYPSNSYNKDRFPVKAVEYAAAAMPIIASDTEGNREFLDERFTRFYDANSISSFKQALRFMISCDDKIFYKMSQEALNWSSHLTFENRAQVAIERLRKS